MVKVYYSTFYFLDSYLIFLTPFLALQYLFFQYFATIHYPISLITSLHPISLITSLHPIPLTTSPVLSSNFCSSQSSSLHFRIVQQTVIGAALIDGGVYSEPIMYLKMILGWHATSSMEQEEWASRHGIIRCVLIWSVSLSLFINKYFLFVFFFVCGAYVCPLSVRCISIIYRDFNAIIISSSCHAMEGLDRTFFSL